MRTEAEQKDSRSQINARELDLGPVFRNSLRISAVSCLCLIALVLTSCEEKEARPQMAPPEVEFTEVVQQDVPIFEEWVAQLNGPTNAEITPKVAGYLLTQNYENGYFVKKGQLLYQIDPRPFQAALDGAKADVAVAQANLERTEADVERDTPLAAQNAIPEKQLDNDIANHASWQAQLLAKQAAMQQAELNLAWTKVYSPVDGIAGVTNSQIGDLVGTSTKMTTISEVNPIWAYFNVSESAFLNVAPRITQIIRGAGSLKNASAGGVHSGRRTSLPGARPDYLRESAGRNSNRHHPDGGAVSERRRHAASGRLWAGSNPDWHGQGCAVNSASRRYRSSVAVPGCGADARQQGQLPSGEGRGARRPKLGDQRRPEAR